MDSLSLGFLRFSMEELPYVIITILIAFAVHEFAHAYVAYKFGDPTAKNEGRLTLNPINHIDPIGTLLILFAGFGWARPVPVNRFNFKKNRKLAGVLVSLAGPISNLVLAILGTALFTFVYRLGITGPIGAILFNFSMMFIHLNIVLFIFNLLPLPPLDGYRIIQDLVSHRTRVKMAQYEVHGMILFLVLVLVPPLYQNTIGLIMSNGVENVSYFLLRLFGLIS